jgi:hypothetical protein
VRKLIAVAIAVVIAVLLARIFWPERIAATGASLGTGPYDVPGLEIQKLEPVW